MLLYTTHRLGIVPVNIKAEGITAGENTVKKSYLLHRISPTIYIIQQNYTFFKTFCKIDKTGDPWVALTGRCRPYRLHRRERFQIIPKYQFRSIGKSIPSLVSSTFVSLPVTLYISHNGFTVLKFSSISILSPAHNVIPVGTATDIVFSPCVFSVVTVTYLTPTNVGSSQEA